MFRTHCQKNRWGKPEKPVKEIAVLGAGLMGAGIAEVSINNNYQVILKDAAGPWLDSGMNGIHDSLKKRVKRRKLTQWNADVIAERLTPTLDYAGLANSDLIIEAVPEELDLKHRVSIRNYFSNF